MSVHRDWAWFCSLLAPHPQRTPVQTPGLYSSCQGPLGPLPTPDPRLWKGLGLIDTRATPGLKEMGARATAEVARGAYGLGWGRHVSRGDCVLRW
jgi:hypothetical protein